MTKDIIQNCAEQQENSINRDNPIEAICSPCTDDLPKVDTWMSNFFSCLTTCMVLVAAQVAFKTEEGFEQI